MNRDLLRQVPLFANLTGEQLDRVAAIAQQRDVPAGEFVFREDDPGTEMFVILEGRVRISKSVPGIGEEALAILEPGSYFGEMALIEEFPRSADAMAHSPAKLSVIEKASLEELMFMDRDLAYELLWTFVRTLSGRLRETNEKIKAFFAMSKWG
jgi:CRP/FNR family cyclic AMP-dependent transcriptional regulator